MTPTLPPAPQTSSKSVARLRSLLLAATLLSVGQTCAIAGTPAPAASKGVPLADNPLFSSAQVPANVLLELSVEYPTALSIANSQGFDPVHNVYVGYFDPNLCYKYVYSNKSLDGTQTITTNQNPSSTEVNYYTEINVNQNDSEDYFKPAAIAGAAGSSTAGQCDGTKWSGAFLNWAGMQTIDPFRWALTGGYRSYDVSTATTSTSPSSILKKAWASGDGGSGETPVNAIVNPQLYTPMPANINGYPAIFIRVWGLGTRMQFTGNYFAINGNNQDKSDTPWTFSGSGDTATNLALIAGALYSVKIRVSACDNSLIPSYTLPSWCTQYTNNYKPEGLIQQYSTGSTVNGVYYPPSIRFGAMGYLNDSSIYRDAGVLRARMEFVGPTAPTPTSPTLANARNEWDSNGVFVQDPDSNGAYNDSGSTNVYTCKNPQGTTVPCASYSGVVNYLNGFGEITHRYKTYDPVNELYYAGLRYFKAQGNGGGNVSSWSALSGSACQGTCTTDAGTLYGVIDQFPVIQTWDDPISYACQKNFVLGIGDVNAHSGGNVAGGQNSTSNQFNSNNEAPMPSAVSADNTVGLQAVAPYAGLGAVGATNYIGAIEPGMNNASLGDTNPYWCCGDDNTYLMAGMAYDAHVSDIRAGDPKFSTPDNLDQFGNKLQIQTVTTFWLDVQEYQRYYYQNMFWLAAKYGGFKIPANYKPYVTAFPGTSTWSHGTDATQPGGSGASLPDNYYGAGNAQAMVSGLTSAFQAIAASASATTTGLAASNYNSVGTAFGSYAVQYDESTWSSNVTAYSTSFSTNGTPTTAQVWSSRDTVSGYQDTATPPNTYVGQFSVITCKTSPSVVVSNGWASAANQPTSANCPLNAHSFRTIATSAGGVNTGAAFEVGSLTAAQAAALTKVKNTTIATGATGAHPEQYLLNYIRGDQSNEGSGIGFRQRTYLEGDVVNSNLTPVGQPSQLYTNTNDPGYSAFVAGFSSSPRSTVVYVGANDGMMHAYNGSLTKSTATASSGSVTGSFTAAGGSEMFSYIPSGMYLGPDGVATDAGLAALANPQFQHHYYVDSTPVVTDVDLNNTGLVHGTTGSPNWITLLVGGLGKGGQSYYAIDVTHPDNYVGSESNLAAAAKWEFTDGAMGYTVGPPLIVKTAKYGWTVIMLSGMNACTVVAGNPCTGVATDTSGGQSYIYLVNPSTGLQYQTKIPASNTTYPVPAGSDQGASYASGLQDATDGGIDALYYGDLLGHLWRLDLRTTGTAGNPVMSDAYAAPVLLAQLRDGTGSYGSPTSGNAQPVTTRPIVSVDPNSGNRYVSVGTGQLLSPADLVTTSQQTFYVFFDGTASSFLPETTTGLPMSRYNYSSNNSTSGALALISINGANTTSTVCGVQTLATPPTFGTNVGGYYLDLSPATGQTTPSCRVNISPLAGVDGTITVAANVPAGTVCNPSGSNEIFSFQTGTAVPLIYDGSNNLLTGGYTAPGGAVSSLSQFNNAGGLSTDVTTQSGQNSQLNVVPPPDPKLNRLNWREVPAVD
jgi:type IV pilus assembly protein PilY1